MQPDNPFISITKDQSAAGLRAVYMILSAEHLRSSCLTSVMIPILTFSSALMATVMNCLSVSNIIHGLERIVELDTGVCTVLALQMLYWRTDVDI